MARKIFLLFCMNKKEKNRKFIALTPILTSDRNAQKGFNLTVSLIEHHDRFTDFTITFFAYFESHHKTDE